MSLSLNLKLKSFLFVFFGLSSGAFAGLMDQVNQGFDSRSELHLARPFNFFESCEPVPASVFGVDPVTGRGREISIRVYRPRPSTKKSVLVIPPTGGVSSIERGYGDRLCEKGIEAWIITEWAPGVLDFKVSVDLGSHDRAARQALAAVRQVVNHMPGRIGVLGTSAGAMIGAVAAAVDSRIQVAALIAGGADLPSLFENSEMETLRTLRQKRLSAFTMAASQYEGALRRSIQIDPSKFGPQLRRKKIGVVVSLNDEVVPGKNQLLLEKVAGAERIAKFEQNHLMAIIMTAFLKSYKVENFFLRNL